MFAFVLLLTFAVSSSTAFKLTQCGSDGSIQLNTVQVSPSPIKMPGTINVKVDGVLLKDLPGLDIDLKVVRKTWLMNIRIPCIFNIGSCSYTDTCTILDRMEKENWGTIGAEIAKKLKEKLGEGDKINCPYIAGTTAKVDDSLALPSLPGFLTMVASGNYIITVKLNNKETKNLVLCLNMELEMKKA